MYQLFVTYVFDSKEKRDGFYGQLEKNDIAAVCAGEKGCITYKYFYPCGEENKLFLLEQWETKEDQRVHAKQPHFALIGGFKEEYGARVEFEIMNAERIG